MPNISDLTSDGFRIPDRGAIFIDSSLLSLKIALEAFFTTYRSMVYSLHVFDPASDLEPNEADYQHRYAYFQACTEAIFHFQHFTELFIKEALRHEHPLLVNEASSNPLILYALLKKQPITSSKIEKINTIEFREAFERFIILLKAGKIKNTQLGFGIKYEEPLSKLNILRNRMWHRGTFVLRYLALDEYIGKYILPFVSEVFAMKRYSKLVNLWKYDKLQCAIDPINEIVSTFQNGTYNVKKVALLKELGRAAYSNPLKEGPFHRYLNDNLKANAERIANEESKASSVEKVTICPVCGVQSLVIYNEIYRNVDDLQDGEQLEVPYEEWRYTWQAKCMCCSFEIYDEIGNPSTYGLPIEDYWQQIKIR